MFNELIYGNLKKVDLHSLTREEAKAEIIHQLNIIDSNFNGLEIIHGYHGGQVLKKLVRDEFKNTKVLKKINLNASITIYITKK